MKKMHWTMMSQEVRHCLLYLKKKTLKMTTSQDAHCHLLQLKKKRRDDDKPLGLLSYFVTQEKKT